MKICKGAICINNHHKAYKYVEAQKVVPEKIQKLPWQTIARICAPSDAIFSILVHEIDKVVIYYKDKYKKFISHNGTTLKIIYGSVSETPEGVINLEWIEYNDKKTE